MGLLETFQPSLNSLYGNRKLDDSASQSVDLFLDAWQRGHLASVGLGTL
jgi:hypothetical protein